MSDEKLISLLREAADKLEGKKKSDSIAPARRETRVENAVRAAREQSAKRRAQWESK